MTWLELHKPRFFCVMQAMFIQIFGISSVIYAAAMSTDTYYYILGFSRQFNSDRSSKHDSQSDGSMNRTTDSTVNDSQGLNQDNLDFYNRDTEVSGSCDIGFDFGGGNDFRNTDMGKNPVNGSGPMERDTISITSRESLSVPIEITSPSYMPNIPRKYILMHCVTFTFTILSAVLYVVVPGSKTRAFVEDGYICYFDNSWLIPILSLLPILVCILVMWCTNFFMVRSVVTFYAAAMSMGLTTRDSNAIEDISKANDSLHDMFEQCCCCCLMGKALYLIMIRLDNDGGKEFRRIIIFPLFYLGIATFMMISGIIRRSMGDDDVTIIVMQVCVSVSIGIGNAAIWVFSDNAIMAKWYQFLKSFFVSTERREPTASSEDIEIPSISVENPIL